jgi:UDP-N-acetylmuramoyl-tripeptide--D-alanyl-D-alanine ligase
VSALLRHFLAATGGSLLCGRPTASFENVSIDTRTLRHGDLFFALRGARLDGHDYLRAAADRGAGAVVIDRLDERFSFHPERAPAVVQVADSLRALQQWGRCRREQCHGQVIGVTGSNGKTTTKEMLAAILRLAGRTLATKGNLNNHIGLPLTLCDLAPDTEYAVIEMGTSKKGDMDVLMDITRPQVGLITNVGKDHLEFLGTPEGVLEVNRVLFDQLPATGTAIINLDDPLLAGCLKKLPCRAVTYSVKGAADVFASDLQPWPLPMRFRLHQGADSYEAELNVPGSFQVQNAVAAAAVAHALGISSDKILEGFRTFRPAAMRMQVSEASSGATLINDAYNANPSSVRASVESFCEAYGGRSRWLVLGDMRELGETARQEHQDMGQWLATQALDRIFLYGRDTRFVRKGL